MKEKRIRVLREGKRLTRRSYQQVASKLQSGCSPERKSLEKGRRCYTQKEEAFLLKRKGVRNASPRGFAQKLCSRRSRTGWGEKGRILVEGGIGLKGGCVRNRGKSSLKKKKGLRKGKEDVPAVGRRSSGKANGVEYREKTGSSRKKAFSSGKRVNVGKPGRNRNSKESEKKERRKKKKMNFMK